MVPVIRGKRLLNVPWRAVVVNFRGAAASPKVFACPAWQPPENRQNHAPTNARTKHLNRRTVSKKNEGNLDRQGSTQLNSCTMSVYLYFISYSWTGVLFVFEYVGRGCLWCLS